MGSADWDFLGNGLAAGSVARGVTTDPDPGVPNGGGNFYYGFNSLVSTDGAVGLIVNANNPNHSPCAKGASVRGAIQRGLASLKTGFSPFLIAMAGGTDITDNAYIIGLEDSDPYRIVVVKGQIINGVPAASASNSLMRSTETYSIPSGGRWHHIRMDVIVELSGDVLIQCFESDLTANLVTSPAWTPIPGCESFTDDVLGVNSGSAPFTAGYIGYGFATEEIARRGYFDQLEMIRQL